jgi:hypothetical protein
LIVTKNFGGRALWKTPRPAAMGNVLSASPWKKSTGVAGRSSK